ncbi:MAG: Gfo/Idh/MocA family oxidoreductase [Bryobacterales bacterium]|nr:Gfo/Idh/MocA family oxidoreductase [Bryobacterales bacterium]
MDPIRVAVAGAGQFGRNHVRVARQTPGCIVTAVVDADEARAREAAASCGESCRALTSVDGLADLADAAVVATPTSTHAAVGCALLDAGLDVLVEKPLAPSLAEARRLVETARRRGRILQVGHLERFNPAVEALEQAVTVPLFFEIHRLSVFTPRSLDVDVVLDLMIHDLDIVLAVVGLDPSDIRAAGVSVLSGKVDIANVRLEFATGCVANLTASRVSTERVRKLRLFQPREYISLDYGKQHAVRFQVTPGPGVSFGELPSRQGEPLARQFEAFLASVHTRSRPKIDGEAGARSLEVALAILDRIEAHAALVSRTLSGDAAGDGVAGP